MGGNDAPRPFGLVEEDGGVSCSGLDLDASALG